MVDQKIIDHFKDKKEGDILDILTKGYPKPKKMFFKKMCITGLDIYPYSDDGIKFCLDYKSAKDLVHKNQIEVVDAKDVSHVEYKLGRVYNTKWVYQITMKYKDSSSIAIGSADIESVSGKAAKYCPEMAWKRAYVRCVLDALRITELTSESFEYSSFEEAQPESEDKKKGIELKTDRQKKAIEGFWEKFKTPKDKRTMPISKEDAAKLIDSFTEEEVNKKV